MKEKTTYAFIKAEEEWKVYVIKAIKISRPLRNKYLLITDYYKSFSLWYGAANNSSQDLSSTDNFKHHHTPPNFYQDLYATFNNIKV